MDHQLAQSSGSVERYLLNDLTESEREAFEAHYFDCPHCAEDLRWGASFLDNAAAHFRKQKLTKAGLANRQGAPAWAIWVTAFAAAGFAIATGYQQLVVLPAYQRAVPQLGVVGPLVRSEAKVLRPGADARIFGVRFEVNSDQSFRQLQFQFRHRKGDVSGPILYSTEGDHGESVFLILPSDRFPDGTYEAELRGRSASGQPWSEAILQTYEFQIKRK
ncbi:MAG: zf-HC2 domain-containing protein [Bryobacteraceae bacterium]